MKKIGPGNARQSPLFLWAFFAAASCGLLPHSACAKWIKTTQPAAAEAPADLSSADHLYAATAHEVFALQDGAWKSVFKLTSLNDGIARLRCFSGALWIQTARALYRLENERAMRVYETNEPRKAPLSFYAGQGNWWLGTPSGIYLSSDGGKTWRKRSDLADHSPVPVITEFEGALFFAAGSEFKKMENNFAVTVLKIFDSKEVFTEESETEETSAAQTFFDALSANGNIYLATSRGTYQSSDGNKWELLPNAGLRDAQFARLAWNETRARLFGLTDHGVFEFVPAKRKWAAQNDGLAKIDMRALAGNAAFYAANSEGLWQWQEPEAAPERHDPDRRALFYELICLEPSMLQIQKRVVKHSNTANSKIKRWHAESRLAALAPNFSFGKDWGAANNIDLDRMGTNDPDRFIEGPWDRDKGVDFDVSWDLGDFIFSSNQTSIDSREKLMVDLRNDLLSEATRIYYERRRLQNEIVYAPSDNEKIHLDNLLRLEELTALLDALTNGYMSKKLEKIYDKHPELEMLWKFSRPVPDSI